ncbi:MAG TPA: hypothetical protein VMV92_37610 [Streptosporangiaceae bacterium]|nr:hypothetical protein [Streptosporangiaceae bacterium]
MNALVLANFPLAFLAFLAIVGIPLWMTFKRPDAAPDYGSAGARANAKVARAYVTTATVGLSTARQHAAARTPVPGRLHATTQRAARTHAARHDRVSA